MNYEQENGVIVPLILVVINAKKHRVFKKPAFTARQQIFGGLDFAAGARKWTQAYIGLGLEFKL